MIIYKTSGNYKKGIQEFEIEYVVDDKTFVYKTDYGHCFTTTFIPKNGNHEKHFFLTYEEAKEHLVNRINKKIEALKETISDAYVVLNKLQ